MKTAMILFYLKKSLFLAADFFSLCAMAVCATLFVTIVVNWNTPGFRDEKENNGSMRRYFILAIFFYAVHYLIYKHLI